jgi:hypothetical protein
MLDLVNTSKKVHINLTLNPQIVDWIDTLRGQEPRSTFINKILLRICFQTQKTFNWENEELKAEDDIKNNRVRKFKTVKEAIKWLKS